MTFGVSEHNCKPDNSVILPRTIIRIFCKILFILWETKKLEQTALWRQAFNVCLKNDKLSLSMNFPISEVALIEKFSTWPSLPSTPVLHIFQERFGHFSQ